MYGQAGVVGLVAVKQGAGGQGEGCGQGQFPLLDRVPRPESSERRGEDGIDVQVIADAQCGRESIVMAMGVPCRFS